MSSSKNTPNASSGSDSATTKSKADSVTDSDTTAKKTTRKKASTRKVTAKKAAAFFAVTFRVDAFFLVVFFAVVSESVTESAFDFVVAESDPEDAFGVFLLLDMLSSLHAAHAGDQLPGSYRHMQRDLPFPGVSGSRRHGTWSVDAMYGARSSVRRIRGTVAMDQSV